MIRTSLPSDLIRGWKSLSEKDHAPVQNLDDDPVQLNRIVIKGGPWRHGRRPAHRRADEQDAAAEILCRPVAAVGHTGEVEGAVAGASGIHDRAGEARCLVRLRAAER